MAHSLINESVKWRIHMCKTAKLIHICGMLHSSMWEDSFRNKKWLIRMTEWSHSHVWKSSSRSHPRYFSLIYVRGHIYTCKMTFSHVGNDAFSHMCGKDKLIDNCDIFHWSTWEDSFIRVKWLIRMSEMTRFHTCVERLNSFTSVVCFIDQRERTHLYV